MSTLRARLAPHDEKLRFLLVGAWNTLFAMCVLWAAEYFIPHGLGSALAGEIGSVGAKQVILLISWIIGVTHNMVTFKVLVFRTKGRWLSEYGRIYMTYAAAFVVESVMVQAISAALGWSLFWSKVPTLAVVTVLSYLGHKYFTFRTPGEAIGRDLHAPGSEPVCPDGPGADRP